MDFLIAVALKGDRVLLGVMMAVMAVSLPFAMVLLVDVVGPVGAASIATLGAAFLALDMFVSRRSRRHKDRAPLPPMRRYVVDRTIPGGLREVQDPAKQGKADDERP